MSNPLTASKWKDRSSRYFPRNQDRQLEWMAVPIDQKCHSDRPSQGVVGEKAVLEMVYGAEAAETLRLPARPSRNPTVGLEYAVLNSTKSPYHTNPYGLGGLQEAQLDWVEYRSRVSSQAGG